MFPFTLCWKRSPSGSLQFLLGPFGYFSITISSKTTHLPFCQMPFTHLLPWIAMAACLYSLHLFEPAACFVGCPVSSFMWLFPVCILPVVFHACPLLPLSSISSTALTHLICSFLLQESAPICDHPGCFSPWLPRCANGIQDRGQVCDAVSISWLSKPSLTVPLTLFVFLTSCEYMTWLLLESYP